MCAENQTHGPHPKAASLKILEGVLHAAGVLGGIGLVVVAFAFAILPPATWDEPPREGETLAHTLHLMEPVYDVLLNREAPSMLVRAREKVLLREASTGALIREFPPLEAIVSSLIWLPRSHRFLAGCRDGRILIMDSRYSSGMLVSRKAHEDEVRCIAVSADGALLATAGEDRLCLWHLAQLRILQEIPGKALRPKMLQFSPDGTRLLVGCDFGNLRIYRTDDLSLERRLQPFSTSITRLQFIEQGRKIIAGDIRGNLFICDARTGEVCGKLSGYVQILSLAVSPDERLVGFTDWKLAIHVYSLETLEKVASLEGHAQSAAALQFSHREPWLYSCGFDGTIRIWDTQTRTELASFLGTTPSAE